ncbi:MAG: hypothetical protein ACPIB0_09565 [Akkermansiaceae bacterium]
MIRIRVLITIASLFAAMHSSPVAAEDRDSDKGKEVVGHIKATLYIGSDTEPGEWASKYPLVGEETAGQMRGIEQMDFRFYRKLGDDTQVVFRSYENWLAPIKPSDEILLSFESRGLSADNGLRLDLEFWQNRRKIIQINPVLNAGKPLLILGPSWRGCRMIIAVELVEK